MLELYDTMSRRKASLRPLEPGLVKMYTCGPTVYRVPHIGNYRSYLMADWIRRALEFQGITVRQVKNITDVGHMRQEMLERGEDKVIAEALARGVAPQEIARHYTERFLLDEQKLNIIPADHFPRATEHVEEMIAIVARLVARGYAYEVQGNVYYDVSRFPGYGALSGNLQEDALQQAVRVEADPLKRAPRDFTLWKLGEPGRDLVWESPWGKGFPGWHIECTAMSIKYLGDQFDIHTGGVDNIFPHHEDEIAQSEAFTGRCVVGAWVHGQHLLADGVKMAKSVGNSFTLPNIESQGIDPLAFRYLCLTARYRTRLDFTFTSLKAAQRGLLRLQNRVWEWRRRPELAESDDEVRREWKGRFIERINDNLDMPGALATTWELVHSDLPPQTRLETLISFDRVLGLGLDKVSGSYEVSSDTVGAVEHRSRHRDQEEYSEADVHREKLARDGFVIEDGREGTRVRPKTSWERREEVWHTISSSGEVASLIREPDGVDVSIGIVGSNYLDDVRRCVGSALEWAGDRSVELVVVDNGSTDGTSEWLEEACGKDQRIRLYHTDHVLGDGAAKNVVLKQCRGRSIFMLDTSVEVLGDIFGPIEKMLEDETVGVAGPLGLRTGDLRHFQGGEGESGDMDAMQGYCFAFRRRRLAEVGLMRESFRFYRNLDLDYSFHFKDRGYRIVADPTLPVKLHEHRVWSELSETERDELSRKNFRRFLDKWGHRTDLLVSGQPRS